MKRIVLPLMMALLSVALMLAAAPTSPASADSTTYTYTFDKAVTPWTPFADKLPVNEHTLVLKQEASGNSYAALTTGEGDALWMMHSFASNGNGVKIAFQARLVEGSDSAAPIYYIGDTKPTSLGDFKKFDRVLTKEWQSFEAIDHVKGTVVVAIGYMTDKANWIAFDNLAVKLFLDSAAAVSAQPLAPADSISYKFDFDMTVKPWVPAAHKIPVNEHTLVLKRELSGNGYAALTTTGDGMVWMAHNFPLRPSPVSNGVSAKVLFRAKNIAGQGTALPVVYMGATKPAGPDDFTRLGAPLGKEWQTIAMEKEITGSNLFVALGYAVDKANWAAFDDVIVKVLYP